jgi:heat shock protein HtpX
MAIAKRVFLFVVVNILVMIMLMVVIRVFGLDRMLTAKGINYPMTAAFCLVWGMGGAFISLLMSRFIAKMSLGVQVIDPNDPDPDRRALVTMVHGLARDAGMSTMPEVGMYESPEVNAFATGPSRSRALVAVSSGLLQCNACAAAK